MENIERPYITYVFGVEPMQQLCVGGVRAKVDIDINRVESFIFDKDPSVIYRVSKFQSSWD